MPSLCRFLRWKNFYARDWRGPEGLAAELTTSDATFSCLRTCQPWGPDDGVAAPETCGSRRMCFERSALSTS